VVFVVGADKELVFAHKARRRCHPVPHSDGSLVVQFILAAASEVLAAMVYPNPAFKDLKLSSEQRVCDIGALSHARPFTGADACSDAVC
jgi:hypothetical protein